MDLGVSSGLLAGLIAIIIVTIATKAAKRKTTNGELRYGMFIFLLAISCFAFSLFAVWLFFNDNDIHEKASEFYSVIGLFLGFGVAAFACFSEYFKVKGNFTVDGIEFHTPWTGTKNESWNDLESVKFNESMYWYILKFKSGKKVRLSSYLLGHGEVLEILKARGFDY